MKSRLQIKKQAKKLFHENKNTSIAVAAIRIYSILFISYSTKNLFILFRRHQDIISALSSILVFILVSAFTVGLASYTLEIVNSEKSDLSTFFSSFENIFNVFLLQLYKTIFILLWSLLLVVPGIIAAYRYRMAEYIMAENPEISPLEAISISKKMMQGKKLNLFDLDCSFIGWFLLSMATLYIVGLYYVPYSRLAVTYFYIDVRNEYIEELNFREEWNARKGSNDQSSQKDDFGSNSDERKQEEWENYTWEHKNASENTNDDGKNTDNASKNTNDDGKTYL